MNGEQPLRAHLLGQGPEPLEALLLREPKLRAQLELAESILVDDYVLGSLTAAERLAFEAHYLRSPDRQAKVALASNLLRSARHDRRRQVALFVLPLLVSIAALAWAWQSQSHETATVVLAHGAQRGSATPRVRLSSSGETLLLELHLAASADGPVTVRVQEIGMEPVVLIRYPRSPSVLTIPIPVRALHAGDYVAIFDAGAVHREFVFQVEP